MLISSHFQFSFPSLWQLLTYTQSLWICLFWVLGEPTRLVKEFIEILTREEERVFIPFPREERARCTEWLLAPNGGGLSLLLSSKDKVQERGGGFISFLVHSCIWASCASRGCGFWFCFFLRICNFLSSVIFQSLGV